MRTSIATVSLSGSLVEKLHACASAGFDGVEIFEPDLIAGDHSPEEIRALATRLGLSLNLYQPLRDLEGVDETTFADNLRRARATFVTAQRLGIDTVLVCSNAGATATVDDDDVSASQLRRIGDLAATYGIRIAFEALAWGRFVDDYRRAWRIVQLADHPAVGVCLDSFHVLSRGHDPAGIEDIPGAKIFYLQLADAPALRMDVLSWSRHHRLFPGEGAFDLTAFVGHVLATGYDGPLSLEVFNDTFRQTDPQRTAVHALRSLRWLQDELHLIDIPDAKPPNGFDFVEIKAEDTGEVEVLLGQLGFTPRGRHRSKPVSLWCAGQARVVLNEQQARDQRPQVAAIGLQVPDAEATSGRARALMAPTAYRRTYASEQPFGATTVPGGVEVFWTSEPAWVGEFHDGMPQTPSPVRVIDHVNLSLPWQTAQDAALLLTSVFGLHAEEPTEVPGPTGLIRSQVLRSRVCAGPRARGTTPLAEPGAGEVRIPFNVAPHVLDDADPTQHVAFGCDDVVALARAARAAGLEFLPVPDNYYDYLSGRFGLDDGYVAELRALDLLYDRGPDGHFVHFYTRTVGSVFFEFVQRFGGYDGYGVDNAPVRLAAQRGRVGTVRT
ncbi:MAG: TIM barrel protein [Mycobacterium sp.]